MFPFCWSYFIIPLVLHRLLLGRLLGEVRQSKHFILFNYVFIDCVWLSSLLDMANSIRWVLSHLTQLTRIEYLSNKWTFTRRTLEHGHVLTQPNDNWHKKNINASAQSDLRSCFQIRTRNSNSENKTIHPLPLVTEFQSFWNVLGLVSLYSRGSALLQVSGVVRPQAVGMQWRTERMGLILSRSALRQSNQRAKSRMEQLGKECVLPLIGPEISHSIGSA